jgi:hypothetical protein
MSNDVIIRNDLPLEIVALQHSTLDEAMALCERAHGIVIPSAKLDEHGCRSALAEASKLYEGSTTWRRQLEAARWRAVARSRRSRPRRRGGQGGDRSRSGPARASARLLHREARAGRHHRSEAPGGRGRAPAHRGRAARRGRGRRRAGEEAEAPRPRRPRRRARRPTSPPDRPRPAAGRRGRARGGARGRGRRGGSHRRRAGASDGHRAHVRRQAGAVRGAGAARLGEGPHRVLAAGRRPGAVPREVGGVTLWKLDEPTCLRLLKAKVKIPGLTLVETETTAAKGRSSAFAV